MLMSDRLRYCLVLAAFACVLRPTNILIWMSLTFMTLMRMTEYRKLIPSGLTKLRTARIPSILDLWKDTEQERSMLFKEAALCG